MAAPSNDLETPKAALDVVVVGGSLTGLLHAILLRRHGHRVTILERHVGAPASHQAGIALSTHVVAFLARYDLYRSPPSCSGAGNDGVAAPDVVVSAHGGDENGSPIALPSDCLQHVDARGDVKKFFTAPRQMTTWDVLFWRLRANFDGTRSEYCSEPPAGVWGNGEGVYEEGRRVVDLVDRDGAVEVRSEDVETGQTRSVYADLVIGADGPSSVVKEICLPGAVVKRRDAGYVVWRGVVPEMEVSENTRGIFERNVTYFVGGGEHALVYEIPGEKGSVRPGERLLNFAWYSNQSPESLADIMTDKDGHRHHDIVPSGQVRDDVWAKQCLHGHQVLAAPYRELLGKISRPFIQKITDSYSPRASFFDGKVLLVGDALAHFRPHIAFSTNQAAFDCLQMQRYLSGEIDLSEWETRVLRFGNLHWLRSIWWGDYFQRGVFFALPSAVWYWTAVATQTFRDVWRHYS